MQHSRHLSEIWPPTSARALVLRSMVLATGLFASASGATALDYAMAPDHPEGCMILAEGLIEAGDTARFKAFLEAHRAEITERISRKYEQSYQPKCGLTDGRRLGCSVLHVRTCFKSRGGSFLEGIEFALFSRSWSKTQYFGDEKDLERQYYLALSAHVPAHTECLSACAIALTPRSRSMNIDARIGYHAPAILNRSDVYSPEEILRSFYLGIEAVALLFEHRGKLDLPDGFIFDLLKFKGPTDFLYVANVSRAMEAGIVVEGLEPDFVPRFQTGACDMSIWNQVDYLQRTWVERLPRRLPGFTEAHKARIKLRSSVDELWTGCDFKFDPLLFRVLRREWLYQGGNLPSTSELQKSADRMENWRTVRSGLEDVLGDIPLSSLRPAE